MKPMAKKSNAAGAEAKPRAMSLEALVQRITKRNRHEVIDWSEPQGKEQW